MISGAREDVWLLAYLEDPDRQHKYAFAAQQVTDMMAINSHGEERETDCTQYNSAANDKTKSNPLAHSRS